MQLLIIGVGDAFTRLHFGSSGVIRAPGPPPEIAPNETERYVLIDCPDLIHRALHEAGAKSGWPVSAARIDDIILTHLHGDHCNGLESFAFARDHLRRDHPEYPIPRLHVTQPVADRLWERLAPAMDGSGGGPTPGKPQRTLADYYNLRIIEPDRPAEVAGLNVRCRYTKHPVPTVGLLISDGESTIGWSADTPFEREHIDWLDQADVFIHESNVGPPHTPIEELNKLPDDIRRKIRLIHLPDDFDRSHTDMAILTEGDVVVAGRAGVSSA